ncbi:MAG: hypothetical protein CMJ76_11325 [Planctomycetaceae bacterium]|nr:hypothetical protein [Planctomycetaceae bacterium]
MFRNPWIRYFLLLVLLLSGDLLSAQRQIDWIDGGIPVRLVTLQDESSLGEPSFDPYGNSGAPNPPAFGEGSVGAPPNKPWFGQPYTAPKDPPGGTLPNQLFGTNSSLRFSDLLRFAETPRLQYGWIHDGNGQTDLSQQEFDFSVVFAFPNFLNNEQPLYVAPSFGLTMLQGAGAVGLSNQVYSAVLDMQWQTDPQQRFNMDLGLGVGVYSDFNTFNSDTIRLTGHALFNLGITEDTTFRGGIVYYDRLDIKMLPAFGLLWYPHPEARIELFFPRPRVSQYLTSFSNYDVWWYYGGELGGGSWTMQQTGGIKTQTDINDIRISTGLEFGLPEQLRVGEHIGFIEAGLVLDREVVFRDTPLNNFDPGTTVMLRAGLGY